MERNRLMRPTRRVKPDYVRILKDWKRSMVVAKVGRERGGRGDFR